MSSIPTELASTLQVGSINRHPDLLHDVAPSTAADTRVPVSVHENLSSEDDLHADEDEDEDDYIPVSVLKPAKPQHSLPPLPDLRFEQSYLRSIAKANTWWSITLITVRDQVMMPLVQGLLLNVAMCGWRHWNQNAQLHGTTVGARVRRWWYGVNNWKIPPSQARR